MADVSFLFTNPRHHVDMMVPVARELERRHVDVQFVSLAELRGWDTPAIGLPTKKAIPLNIRRKPGVGAGVSPPTGVSTRRRLAQRAVSAVLIPRLKLLIRRSRVIVIPNDWVFPYSDLLPRLAPTTRVVLMQEGIRMRTPNGDEYGTGPIAKLCAWGVGSAEFFEQRGTRRDVLAITGAPRLDTLDPPAWKARGEALLEKLGLRNRPIGFLSNPIEIQGYGSRADKLALFERFLVEAAPVLEARDLEVIVKNHLFEDPAEFAAIAAKTPAARRVRVLPDEPLFSVLAMISAGVVLTSTVGLEAMMFGAAVGALEIPGHGFGFEYVEQNAAVGLAFGQIATGLATLLAPDPTRDARAAAFIQRHLHDRGRATEHVAEQITALLRS